MPARSTNPSTAGGSSWGSPSEVAAPARTREPKWPRLRSIWRSPPSRIRPRPSSTPTSRRGPRPVPTADHRGVRVWAGRRRRPERHRMTRRRSQMCRGCGAPPTVVRGFLVTSGYEKLREQFHRTNVRKPIHFHPGLPKYICYAAARATVSDNSESDRWGPAAA